MGRAGQSGYLGALVGKKGRGSMAQVLINEVRMGDETTRARPGNSIVDGVAKQTTCWRCSLGMDVGDVNHGEIEETVRA